MRKRKSKLHPKKTKNLTKPPEQSPLLVEVPLLQQQQKRVYKRWIVVSSVISLLFAYLFFPLWFGQVRTIFPTDLPLSKWTEYLVDTSFVNSFLPSINLSLPAGFIDNITGMLKPSSWTAFMSAEAELRSPGRKMSDKGAQAYYPVILIPGVISTGLEVWRGKKCSEPYFRQRLWGTLTMLRMMILDRECWLEHMRLDVTTGSDPGEIKVRAAQGLEAADFMFPGIWVLGRIIENLAQVGYDSNTLYMAAYDWRMGLVEQEKRDKYYTKLKALIETVKRSTGRKVALVSHSHGAVVIHHFMKWVEADSSKVENGFGGNGGTDWVDKHLKTIVNVAGPMLGAAKFASCIVSGEMRDTAQLGRFESFLVDSLLNKRERASLFRTWIGPFSMLPKGGNRMWNGDADGQSVPLLTLRDPTGNIMVEYSYDQIDDILKLFLPPDVYARIHSGFSTGIANPLQAIENDHKHATWHNPLESRLPNAPNLTIYSLYGIGSDTEKGYEYVGKNAHPDASVRSIDSKGMPMPWTIDLAKNNAGKHLSFGVYNVEGDGSVPLLSLGYMPAYGWKQHKHLNPAGVRTIVVEYLHEPLSQLSDFRGGPKASDHVGILGNHAIIEDMIRVVCNFRDKAEDGDAGEDDLVFKDEIRSNILEMSEATKLFE